MGFVSTFCTLSGCSPIATEALVDQCSLPNAPQLQQAIEELVEEELGQQGRPVDLTVLGPHHADGTPMYSSDDSPSTAELLALPSSLIRSISGRSAAYDFQFGYINSPDSDIGDYLVSEGPYLMVLTSVVALLPLAAPQLTIERVWRLAMMQGGADTRGLSGVDYGEVGFGQDQFLVPAPGLAEKELLEMTRAGASVNAIKREIVHTGKWWVWMRPDNFPRAHVPSLGTEEPSKLLAAAADIFPPPSSRPSLTSLPPELLIPLVSHLPFPSIIALGATCKALHYTLLSLSVRDATACVWLRGEGRYWTLPESGADGKGWDPCGSWEYVRGCAESGSMRNRKRMWAVFERIEKLAMELGA